nr:transcriptional repressor [uncultured Merdimonas sp.]
MDGQKAVVIQKLKDSGCRITKQRLMLLDIILEEECSCCKEIYYRASRLDPNIGTATVYRMVNKLEEIGAISRKNMYKIACSSGCKKEEACLIELDDDTVRRLSAKNWIGVISAGLKACGYIDGQQIRSVKVQPCEIIM